MSQLHTYDSYINYLVDLAKEQQLDNLSNGILQTHFIVDKLQAELKAKDELLKKSFSMISRYYNRHGALYEYTLKETEVFIEHLEQALKGGE